MNNINHSIKIFTDEYYNTGNLNKIKKDQQSEVRVQEILKISSYITNFCETVRTGTLYFIYKDVSIQKLSKNITPPLLHAFQDQINTDNPFPVNEYWVSWSKPGSSHCNQDCSNMMNYCMNMPQTSIDEHVVILMYKLLFDYCIQRLIFRVGILNGNPSDDTLRKNISKDIYKYESPNKQLEILETCMIRTKMVIFLRIFHGIHCTGNMNTSQWSFVLELSRFRNMLGDIYNDIKSDQTYKHEIDEYYI